MDFRRLTLVAGFLINGLLLNACDLVANADESASRSARATEERQEDTRPEGHFWYEFRTEERSRQDDRFPFGYWEVIRVYPEVISENRPMMAETVSGRIATVAHQYGCAGMGNEAFRTREIYLGNGVLSMVYEAHWTCATMTSPEKHSGFLNLDLADASDLDLDEQFRDRYAYERFQKRAVVALNEALEDQAENAGTSCAEVQSISGFHTDGKELWVASMSREPATEACDVKVGYPLSSVVKQLKPESPLGRLALK